MKYHDIQLTGSLQVTGSLAIPTGTTAERPSNPNSGSIRLNSSNGTVEVYTAVSGSEWQVVGAQTAASSPLPDPNVEYLVVAGGGGSSYDGGGGAGAGGLLSSSIDDVVSGSVMTVTVGAGGAAYANGIDSTLVSTSGTSFSTVTSIGGGNGSGAGSSYVAGNGGSGGGGAGGQYNDPGGTGTVGQGNAGGTSGTSGGGATYPGSGGGGAGAVGGAGVNSGGSGKPGGIGLQSKITGTATYYAGGGGGAASGTGGAGGLGGGGAGGSSAIGTVGTANTGGGAGGSNITSGVTGGSGVVILAYPSASLNAGGGIVGDAGNGRKYHQFNESGTFKVGSSTDFQLPATNNLKLHLDAANFDSYPGTGTTWTDLSGNNNNFTLDGSGISWVEGGWFTLNDGGGSCTSGAITNVTAATFAMWIKTTDIQSLFWSYDNGSSYIGAYRVGNKEYHGAVGSPVYYQDLVEQSNIYDNIRTGNWIFVEFKSVDFSGWNANTYFNKYSTYTFSTTDIGAYYIYDKNLTAAESLQLYNATKTNFV